MSRSIIARVISGGQSGVDVAALRAARSRHLLTGGWMPHGFLTLDGFRPEYEEEFGMWEHASSAYPPRTRANVLSGDMTVRIAEDFASAGEMCTLRAVQSIGARPVDVAVRRDDGVLAVDSDAAARVARAILDMKRALQHAIIVNVAGNSEHTSRGIEVFAERFLGDVFDIVSDV